MEGSGWRAFSLEPERLIYGPPKREEDPEVPSGRVQHADNGLFADLLQISQDLLPPNKSGLLMTVFLRTWK